MRIWHNIYAQTYSTWSTYTISTIDTKISMILRKTDQAARPYASQWEKMFKLVLKNVDFQSVYASL